MARHSLNRKKRIKFTARPSIIISCSFLLIHRPLLPRQVAKSVSCATSRSANDGIMLELMLEQPESSCM